MARNHLESPFFPGTVSIQSIVLKASPVTFRQTQKQHPLYRAARLGWVWIHQASWGKRVFRTELVAFLAHLLSITLRRYDMKPITVGADGCWVDAQGLKIDFCTNTSMELGTSQALEFHGGDETPVQLDIIRRYLPPGSSYIDVGANNGFYYALPLARERVGVRIICFDPNPVFQYKIKKNFTLNGLIDRLETHQMALSDKKGEAFLASQKGASAHIADENASGYDRVSITTLDSFASMLDPVAIIKVDIEGHEFQFLKGAVETIKRNKPVIVTELDDTLLRRNGQSSIKDVTAFLETIDYKVLRIGATRDAILCPAGRADEVMVDFPVLSPL